jgi:hypothetical protein
MRTKSKPQATPSRYLEAALRYAQRGWPVFPLWPRDGKKCTCGAPECSNPGKHPIGHLALNGFKSAVTDAKVIRNWWRQYPDAGIGIPTGAAAGVIVLDVDVKNDKDGTLALGELILKLGPLLETRMASTPSSGSHCYFMDPGGITSGNDKLGLGLDLKADGGYVVAPPSHGLYQWVRNGKNGTVKRPVKLPPAWIEHLRSLDAPRQTSSSSDPEADLELVAAALAVIPNGNDVSRDQWIRVGMATHAATGGSDEGFGAFDAWSAKWPKYNAADTRKAWGGFKPDRIGVGTLIHLADQASPGWRQKAAELDQTQTGVLLDLAKGTALFHTDDHVGFADVQVDNHRETWPLRSRGFQLWLGHRYYTKTKSAPNREALNSAIATLEAKARFEAPVRKVYVRTGGHGGRIYLDLCDDEWRAVEIGPDGWRVIADPPVRFHRARGMHSLPVPILGGNVDDLLRFINVKSDGDFVLLAAWIVAAFRDRGPYPVLVLGGEEGTGKSTLVRIVRSLVDPNKVPLRTLPREERDLYIAACNGYVLAFDNVSELREWLSDALSRLSTGGGFATRTLYTDTDEVLIDATRPIVLNGIEDFIAKSDLAERCVRLRLTLIADKDRQVEAELNAAFEERRPAILGALLDMVVHGLRELPQVRLDTKPRMADFAKWATACEGAVFEPGTFAKAYRSNRRAAVADVLAADMVADAVRVFINREEEWSGTAGQLLDQLDRMVGERQAKRKLWPDSPRALRSQLQKLQAPLRKIGITVTFDRTSRQRAIRIEKVVKAKPANP